MPEIEVPSRGVVIFSNGAPVGTLNPIPVSDAGSGPGSNVTVVDIEDGAGTSIMDTVNNAARVNIVAGGISGGVTEVTYADAAVLSITLGGNSQELFPANASRTGLIVQNNSDADLWVNFGAAATEAPPSLRLIGGGLGLLQFPDATGRLPKGQVTIIGATTAQAFSAKQATDA